MQLLVVAQDTPVKPVLSRPVEGGFGVVMSVQTLPFHDSANVPLPGPNPGFVPTATQLSGAAHDTAEKPGKPPPAGSGSFCVDHVLPSHHAANGSRSWPIPFDNDPATMHEDSEVQETDA